MQCVSIHKYFAYKGVIIKWADDFTKNHIQRSYSVQSSNITERHGENVKKVTRITFTDGLFYNVCAANKP